MNSTGGSTQWISPLPKRVGGPTSLLAQPKPGRMPREGDTLRSNHTSVLSADTLTDHLKFNGGGILKPNMAVADGLFQFFNRPVFKFDGNMMNLSVEDWISRTMVIFGFYFPNTVGAFATDQHKWEALARNVITFYATLGLYIFTKSNTTGLDPLVFNQYMQKKIDPAADKFSQAINERLSGEKNGAKKGLKTFMAHTVEKYLVNPFRPQYSVEDLFKYAGVTSKKWGDVDQNIQEAFFLKYKKIAEEHLGQDFANGVRRRGFFHQILGKSNASVVGEALEKQLQKPGFNFAKRALMEKDLQFLRHSQDFIRRFNGIDFAKVSIIALATMFVVGGFVMDLVFTLFAPFDHDFDPTSSKYKPKPFLVKIQRFLFPKLNAKIKAAEEAKKAKTASESQNNPNHQGDSQGTSKVGAPFHTTLTPKPATLSLTGTAFGSGDSFNGFVPGGSFLAGQSGPPYSHLIQPHASFSSSQSAMMGDEVTPFSALRRTV